MNVTITWPGNVVMPDRVHLAVYDDELVSHTGPSQRWSKASCMEKVELALYNTLLYKSDVDAEGRNKFNYSYSLRNRIRRRWWFLVLADCSDSDFQVDYL